MENETEKLIHDLKKRIEALEEKQDQEPKKSPLSGIAPAGAKRARQEKQEQYERQMKKDIAANDKAAGRKSKKLGWPLPSQVRRGGTSWQTNP